MVGTILLNNPKYNSKNINQLNNKTYTVSLIKNDIEESNNDNKEILIESEVKEKDTTIKQNQESETKAQEIIETKKESTKTNDKKEENIIKIHENNDSIIEDDSPDTEPNKDIVDNNIYVTIYRQNGDILTLELEEYIIGVVAGEMPASFNIEALKAQSILARTYTIKAINTGKVLTDTTSTQTYKSNDELKTMWGSSYNTYYNKIKNAVDYTKGFVLTYNGNLIEAVYHSTSNGKTEYSENVWKYSFPYLSSVDSPYDITNKNFTFTTFFTYEELSKKLNTQINIDTIFNIILNNSSRVKTIEFNNITLTGVEFRTKLGLRSADFILDKTNEGVNITTKGYGHGVWMSQYGANGMANNGSDYETILKHYYKGVSITQS